METRKFQGYNCDLTELQNKIKTYFAGKNYRVINFHKEKIYLTQAYKNEMGNKAIIVKIEGNPSEFDVTLGFGERITNIQTLTSTLEKISFQTKLLLGEPTLDNNFWNFFTTQADLKRNTYGLKRTQVTDFSPVWREREIVKEIEVIYCRYCGAKNNARMTSCTQCGANLH